jgi:hypothetical protein
VTDRFNRSAVRLWIVPVITAAIAVAPPAVPAARPGADGGITYHVSPAGHDANAGDARHPFATIQRAADVVQPGDTVIVANGVYHGDGSGTPCASAASRPLVCLSRGGTAAAWVTFRAQVTGGAKIDGRANTSTAGFSFQREANFIRIEGFELYGIGNAAQSGNGFELFSGGHDVVLSQNHIHDIGRLCTDTTNGEAGIFVEQPRVTITRNIIHDIGRFGPGENGCEPTTLYYRNHDHGIYLNGRSVPGGSDAVITNNVFFNLRRGWAIQVYPGTIAGLKILNNTFATPNPFNAGHIVVAASTRGAQIINNVFADPLTAGLFFYGPAQVDMFVANNLSSRALATGPVQGVRFSNNIENTDPQLSGPEFRPKTTSPVIDAGMTLRDVPVDLRGVARPQQGAWDIGAHEWRESRGDAKTDR